jgi:hypothetical protein
LLFLAQFTRVFFKCFPGIVPGLSDLLKSLDGAVNRALDGIPNALILIRKRL